MKDRDRWKKWEQENPERARARFARKNRWRDMCRRVEVAKYRAAKLCDHEGNCLLCHQPEHTMDCPARAYLAALSDLSADMNRAPRP